MAVVDTPTTVSPSFQVGIELQVSDILLTDTPWGRALTLYSCEMPACGTVTDTQKKNNMINKRLVKPLLNSQGIEEVPSTGVAVYCVNCGMTGNVNVQGSISFRLVEGVSAATMSIAGNLAASLGLAINGFASQTATPAIERIAAVGLPGFTIPKIVTVGPELTLDMSVTIRVSADGQLFAGGTLTMPDFVAFVDFVHGANSHSSGWTPQYTWEVGAFGTISAQATLGIPFGLALGIDILGGKYKEQAALVDTPEMTATMSYTGSIEIGSDTCTTEVVPLACEGVTWSIGLANRVDMTILNANE